MYTVFSDLHHNALFESLRILFEDRLGGAIYRPIGLEWFPDYWAVYTGPGKEATAQQYLGLDQGKNRPTDIRGVELNDAQCLNLNYVIEDGVFYVKDIVVDKTNRAVTFEKFKTMKFDILLCSMPQHIPMFIDLQKKFQPQAKLIFQAGNSWTPDRRIPNFMGSIAPVTVPNEINAVFYHQEFDLNVFKYVPPVNNNKVYSFVHYMQNKHIMSELAAHKPGWEFISHGAGMESSVTKTHEMAEKIASAAFIFHNKPGGDGFGHTIHSSYAVGRPAIIWGSQYRGKLAGNLFTHMETCIDVEQCHSIKHVSDLLTEITDSDKHQQMCTAAHDRFKQLVDYDVITENVKTFLSKLR